MIPKVKDFLTFVRVEALGGVLLILAAAIAIAAKNSPLATLYDAFTHAHFEIQFLSLNFTMHEVINDFLMAIFFLVIGLEIKREFLVGEISDRSRALLPIIGAIGGVIVPASIYLAFNFGQSSSLVGWPIPTATDIAFSLAVISLFGRSLPFSLKIFLTALAIIDDLFAIVIIALLYTTNLSTLSLIPITLVFLLLIFLNKTNRYSLAYSLIPALLLYYLIYDSGIHATVAGVLLALTVPLKVAANETESPLTKLEHRLHPWVTYGILPLFAFANAGIDLRHLSWEMLSSALTLGCLFGLFIGKQLGVFSAIFVVLKLGVAKLPEGATLWQLYGVSILTGIGFTMSLFMGGLAVQDPAKIEYVKLGVLIGSLLSFIFGALVLVCTRSPNIKT